MLFGQIGFLAHLEGDVLEHREIGEEPALLELHAHPAPQLEELAARERVHVFAHHFDRRRAPGCNWPPISRMSVVLPEPLAPMMPTTLPRGIVRFTLRRRFARAVRKSEIGDFDDRLRWHEEAGGRRLARV